MKKLFKDPVIRWFAALAVIAILISGVAYHSIQGLIQDFRRVQQTHEVLQSLKGLLASLGDVYAGQRGYVSPGQDQLSAPYHVALGNIQADLERLGPLTADDPAHRQLPQIKSKLEELLALTAPTIAARLGEGSRAAQEQILSGETERVGAELRQIIAAMDEEQGRLLEIRTEIAERAVVRTLGIGGSCVAIIVLILLFVFLFIRRESELREKTTASLTASLQKSERLTRDVKLSIKMVELLQSCRTSHEARGVIEKMVPQLLPDVSGAVCLIDSAQDLLEAVMTWGDIDSAAGRRAFASDDCWGLRRGRMHLVLDSRLDLVCGHALFETADGQSAATDYLAHDGSSRAHLCLPMIAHGETLGVMYLRSGMMTEDIQRLARAVSEQISLALSNLKLQETLRAQSVRDPLTGLFNRRYMEATLAREISHAQRHEQPISIIMLDVDHFKQINDTHGHEAGDSVLIEFGRLLRESSRREDIACRYGGEEFILILPEAPLEVAEQRAEQLRQSIRALKVEFQGQSLGPISSSLGVAAFRMHGERVEDILRAADAALYRAKQEGRDRIVTAECAITIALTA